MVKVEEIQKIISHFLSVGTLKREIFRVQNVDADCNAHLISTDYGFFVVFQADFICSKDENPENILFAWCKQKLNVIPERVINDLQTGQTVLELPQYSNTWDMKYFCMVNVALRGDEDYYKKWFSFREVDTDNHGKVTFLP
ncbi:MAG: hypothetical protein HZA34_03580 [Candidatus Pacebacteria bacterium]|nr:hypothetical protein [Candidatus Paceibacterota bacterium]